MNNQLITVTESDAINGEVVKAVNARELHEFLGVGKDFSNWIKQRIEKYGFVEGADYAVLAKTGEAQPRGLAANRKEYAITLDMAKELSMVERNDKGKKARQYFIRCEKELKAQQPQFEIPKTLGEALLLAGKLATEVEQQAAQLEAQAPSVEFADRVSNAKGAVTRRNAAKILDYPALAFNEWLKANRFSNGDGMPSSSELKRGHQRVTVGEKNGHAYSTPRITTKGLRYYASKLYVTEVPDNVLDNIENQSN